MGFILEFAFCDALAFPPPSVPVALAEPREFANARPRSDRPANGCWLACSR